MSGADPCTASKDRALMAEIRARHKAKAADKRGAEIADDIAVEILKQQRVVLIGIHHQLHAGVVDNVLAVKDFRKSLRHLARTAQKTAHPTSS